ncbi:MAG: ATP-binding protein [Ilumatobacteraceae bacterium]|nr:ATP-binding protein [Ilumatobacteraceae bacterium]
MTSAEILRNAFLTSDLTEEQRTELISAGTERGFVADDQLFDEGRTADQIWILVEGTIELSRFLGGRPVVVAEMSTPGQWAGGLTAWGEVDGHSAYRASARATAAGRCLVVPSDQLSELVGRWAPFAKHMITGVYQTIRGIDALARERESLVALGTLAAGLAHEINNPAAASLRSVEALSGTGEHMLSSLVALAEHGIIAGQFLELDRLRLALGRTETATSAATALAVADREETLGSWMDVRSIPLAWRMAPVLASAGADEEWLEQVESTVGTPALDAALRWISSTFGAAALMDELRDAISRISHLVEDVKTYSQLDRAEVQMIDITSGIESTLVMLGPKLHGVTIERSYDPDLPTVEVFAAELNQVWTNLIENAADAMGSGGTLRISTAREGDVVVVRMDDDGCGMPTDVLARVFEPFFTTKDVGKGTGLGLDISRRIIVDRHGGEIDVDSVPGRTSVSVRLPLRR